MRSFIVTYTYMTTDFRKYSTSIPLDTTAIHPVELRNEIIAAMDNDLKIKDCLCSYIENYWEVK